MSFRFVSALLIVCSFFTSARAQTPGSLDSSFDAGAGIGGRSGSTGISDVALQGDGKTVLVGSLAPWPKIMRLLADGAVDRSFSVGNAFGPTTEEQPTCVEILTDGKIVVAGSFRFFDNVPRQAILRLNGDGSLDAAYNPGSVLQGPDEFSRPFISHLAAQTDGRIMAAGAFRYTSGGVSRSNLARFNADGALDTSFQPQLDLTFFVHALALSPGGKIMLNHGRLSANGIVYDTVRLASDGALDASFDAGTGAARLEADLTETSVQASAIEVQPDGSVLVAGQFNRFNSTDRPGLVRLMPTGTVDPGFVPAGFRHVYSAPGQTGVRDEPAQLSVLRALPDGRVLVGGFFERHASTTGPVRLSIALLQGNGTLDASFDPTGGFGPDPSRRVYALAVRAGTGEIVATGGFSSFNGTATPGIAQLTSGGALDAAFRAKTLQGLDDGPFAVAMQEDGLLLVAGAFREIGGQPRAGLARLQPDGTLDSTFNAGSITGVASDGSLFSAQVDRVALQQDGKIVIAGPFKMINGVPRKGLARLHADGSLDSSFDIDDGFFYETAEGRINELAFWQDPANPAAPEKMVILGGFTQHLRIDGGAIVATPREGIARLNADGTLDASFDPGSGFTHSLLRHANPRTVLVQPDGKIIVGGDQTHYNGAPAPAVVRLHSNGTRDTTFDATASIGNDVALFALLAQTDGKFFVAGSFALPDSSSRLQILRLNANGGIDATFDPGDVFTDHFGGDITSLAQQPDGKLIVAGRFLTYRGVARKGVARLLANGALDTAFELSDGFGGDRSIFDIALQDDGQLIVAGAFYRAGGTVRHYLARLHGDGAGSSPGSLRFVSTTYSANESGGGVRLTVRRTGGTVGAVGVSYAPTGGSAQSGTDYTGASGILTWPTGDATPKFFDVALTPDTLAEGSETLIVTLTNTTGGATLGAATATATILDPPFDAWRFINFGPAANNPQLGWALADFDSDGSVNLVEFALAISPLTPSTAGLPVASFSNGQPTLAFTRNPAATDIIYTVQVSSNLVVWTDGSTYSSAASTPNTAATSDITPINSATDYTVVRDNTPSTPAPRFMRLNITRL